jgi:hypothetical protein
VVAGVLWSQRTGRVSHCQQPLYMTLSHAVWTLSA